MTVTLTPGEFQVDLGTLSSAIGTIRQAKDAIDEDANSIGTQLVALEGSWSSPAGTSYAVLVDAVGSAMKKLLDALAEMLTRMQKAYDNYLAMETANTGIVK